MKLKIVIKVELCCDKCRAKARKIAAGADGVSSVAIEGDDKNKVVVVGECVDAAELTCSLRKKFNCVKLLSVEEVKPPQPAEKKPEPKQCEKKPPSPCCWPPPCYCSPPCYPPPHCDLYKVVCDPNPPSTCTLM